MTFLTEAECQAWCKTRGIVFDRNPIHTLRARGSAIVAQAPDRSSAQLELSRRLGSWLVGEDVLLWMTDWPFCTSVELLSFESIRSRFGGRLPLIDQPGQVFPPGESDALIAMLFLVLAYRWDALLVCESGAAMAGTSHDKLVGAWSDAHRDHDELVRIVEAFGAQIGRGKGD